MRTRRLTARHLVATLVVVAAACADQRLATPTSPSGPVGGFAGLETGDGLAVASPLAAGPLASLSIDPSVFKGGQTTRGTVTLTAPAPAGGTIVALSSDDAAATVPASVTIAAGGTSATFQIATRVVPSDVRIAVTASAGGGSLTALLRITPEHAIASLDVAPSRITAGDSATGTVTLSSKAPASGTLVSLASANVDARVPASITIASGSTSGTFTVDTRDVSSDTEIWITASVGRDTRDFQIRVVPSRSGGAATGTVTIGGAVE